MEDTPSTRRSTGERIGPWFVLQRKNPTAPGLRLSVLLTLARRGHITPKSIVRGPTTGQFWRYAAQVKGLSRVFGVCWHCGASVSPDSTTCPKCRSAQEIPDDPDQFLENHSALPVMREVGPRKLDDAFDFDSERALPGAQTAMSGAGGSQRNELATRDARPNPGNSPRDPRATPGTRSMTLARGDEDVILSASELAAAFQLDLPAATRARRTSRRLWRLTKYAALLALLLAGGAATAFYFKPAWYQQANEAARPYVEKGQTWLAKVTGRAPKKSPILEDLSGLPPITPIQLEPSPERSTAAAKTGSLESEPVTDTVLPRPRPGFGSLIVPPVDANAPIDALAGGTSMFVPTTRPLVSTGSVDEIPNLFETIRGQQGPSESNKPVEAAATPPAEPPTAAASDKPPPAASFDPSKMTLDEAIATAATLRTSALDAEARKDWAAAVLIYEQISKLPETAHPSDLKVKLAVARERARS